jgi:hypothetical protein
VTNNSGEDYENAQTRLIVGKVHILDQIGELAQREYPYGRPVGVRDGIAYAMRPAAPSPRRMRKAVDELRTMAEAAPMVAKEVIKEGLSEYFLYTIEGTETIPTGWSKRLQSFDVEGIPVVNLYKYEQERYGDRVVRFLSFANDEEHELGETPIPDGALKVYRTADEQNHLAYEGQSSFKYIPVGEEVELSLGDLADVVVEPTLMEFKTDNYRFDNDRNIDGWDEINIWKVEVRNTRVVPVKIEIRRNFDSGYWDLARTGQVEAFEKIDLDTVRFTLELPPRSKRTFGYTHTAYRGVRTEDWVRRSR